MRGRPRRADEPSSERLEFRTTPTERDDLDTVARDCGKKRADVIREAVNEYVSDYRGRKVFVR